MKPRRYQLRKDAVAIVAGGHPWLFRDHLSSAASVFRDGDWLRLVDGANQVIGHGLYEAEGAIAIRVLRTGAGAPDAAWWRDRLAAAIARRRELAGHTDGIRLVHGESDGVPAVVVDRFGDALVVASYSAGADALARYTARALPTLDAAVVGPAAHVILRPARRRRGPLVAARVLRGAPVELARFTEDGLTFAVDLAAGHKTGTYLDLRGLRRALRQDRTARIDDTGALAQMPLAGARVLNLFAYTGMLGRAAEAAGAAEIVQVDQSERALDFARAHHVGDAARHRFLVADAFHYTYAPTEQYDLVIVDPPSMTSRVDQVPRVLATYRKLYAQLAPHVRPGGALVAACCTSRVPRGKFHEAVRAGLGS
ncbi:MAG: class I SAM-dependent rRNA methyltransferase, partial [Acidobacteriota bacterium]